MIQTLLKIIFGGPSSQSVPFPVPSTGHGTTRRATRSRKCPSNANVPATGADWKVLGGKGINLDSITVYDPRKNPLRLSRADVVTHGGEGIIYQYAPRPKVSVLIKVCKPENRADAAKMATFRERIAAMLALHECGNADFLAWPRMPVMDRQGDIIGFAMNRCTGRTLRALLAPCQVRRFFPGWNRIHVTQVAINFLDAVRMLARHHVLVNDFNPSNFLVDIHGQIRLIDCDSFQIPLPGKPPLTTRTFTPEFCAPELLLQPENFNRPRTPEQVRFSLAILIYMLLMSGLHPYARCGGGDPAENLKSGKCPLVKDSGVRMPVSWYKSVSWLTPSLKACFIRMFVDGFAHPEKRPLLGEMRTELVNFLQVMKSSRSENQRAILPTTARKGNQS